MSILLKTCALLLVAGCAGSDSKPEPAQAPTSPENATTATVAAIDESPSTPPATASGAPPATASGAPPTASGSPPPVSAACVDPCQRLLDAPFSEVAPKIKEECGFDWRDTKGDQCHLWDTMRNCVYAAGGKSFKKTEWREYFSELPWYKPKADFKHEDLSRVAKANIKFLKESKRSCETSVVTKPGKAVKELEADLDGDGNAEKIRVTTSRIFVDGKVFVHKLKPYDATDVKVTVIDLDTNDKYKELMIASYHYEQNAYRRILYKRDKGVAMSEKYNWHDIELKLDGKGTIRMHSGECGQDRTEVYGFKKGVFQLTKKKVKGRFREELCSACPFVYVWEQGSWAYQGEILRNLRSVELESTHHLRLGLRQGKVRIRLAERKRETTFVDSLELIARYADGTEEVISANECSEDGGVWCALDNVYHRIELGQEVDFSVELERPAELVLRARGYYLPHL